MVKEEASSDEGSQRPSLLGCGQGPGTEPDSDAGPPGSFRSGPLPAENVEAHACGEAGHLSHRAFPKQRLHVVAQHQEAEAINPSEGSVF